MKYIKYIVMIFLGFLVVYGCVYFILKISLKNEIRRAYNGNHKAQLWLGNTYYHGWGVARNYDKALEWYLKAAEQDYANAQYNAGSVYEHIYHDYPKALKWYQKAANHNHSNAQNSIGTMFLQGKGVTKDHQTAINWFQKAVEQGCANAQYNLAVMYQEGLGIAKNYEKAYQLNKKAAERDVANAQYNLGAAYYHGWGVAKNKRLALKWFERSTKNSAELQYKIGLMYQLGIGIAKEKNISKAKKLYTKAAKQGHVCAKARLEEIREGREPALSN